MTKNKNENDKEMKVGFNFSLGGLFGKMFEGLGDISELIEELADRGQVERRGEFDLGRKGKDLKGKFGISMRTGIGEDVDLEVKTYERKKTPQGEEVREPLVDRFEEEGKVIFYVELPGVEEEDIETEYKENILSIKAAHDKIKYSKKIEISQGLGQPSFRYRNGILKIEFSLEENE